MKSRPILFSGAMVRAILDGSKTQTRRVVKLTDSGRVKAAGSARNWHLDDPNAVLACPYGQPGDRLWIRETWAQSSGDNRDEKSGEGNRAVYRADWIGPSLDGLWKPSIHMPRWASRITLEIFSVRVEQLQEISDEDSVAEGIKAFHIGDQNAYGLNPDDRDTMHATGKDAYRALWESINGPGSWTANPSVWVVEFRRLEVMANSELSQPRPE